jgi:hypothetical protein
MLTITRKDPDICTRVGSERANTIGAINDVATRPQWPPHRIPGRALVRLEWNGDGCNDFAVLLYAVSAEGCIRGHPNE